MCKIAIYFVILLGKEGKSNYFFFSSFFVLYNSMEKLQKKALNSCSIVKIYDMLNAIICYLCDGKS